MSENRRKKPNKKGRNADNDTNQEKTEPKNRKQINLDDPKERLRARIKQMQKDRAKGSNKCEENANHEY